MRRRAAVVADDVKRWPLGSGTLIYLYDVAIKAGRPVKTRG